ncbi:MAG TPA: hypothetical protein DCP85_09080 [Elusimicrobia bacterium]|nr:hypothetical protein [Elusimicrobiota bacterium]
MFITVGLLILFVDLWVGPARDKEIGCAVLIGAGLLHILFRKFLSSALVEHQSRLKKSLWCRYFSSYEDTLNLITWGSSLMLVLGGALLLQIMFRSFKPG